MLAMEVGLGLFGQGTWVPRYPEYGLEVECVSGPIDSLLCALAIHALP